MCLFFNQEKSKGESWVPNLLPNQKPFSTQITNPSDLTVDSGMSSYFGDLQDHDLDDIGNNILFDLDVKSKQLFAYY